MGSNSKQQCLALSLLLPPPFYTMGSNSKQQCLALSAPLIDCCYLAHFTQWGQPVNNSVLRHQFQPLLYIIIIYIYISALSIDCCNLPHFTQWGRTVTNSALRYQLSSGGNIGFKLPKPTSRLSLACLHVHQDILDFTGLVNSLKIATS